MKHNPVYELYNNDNNKSYIHQLHSTNEWVKSYGSNTISLFIQPTIHDDDDENQISFKVFENSIADKWKKEA